MVRKYLRIYQAFIATSFAEALTYRAHAYLVVVMDILFYFSAVLSVDFIFDHIDAIGTWSRPQFLFFIAFMLAVDHLHMTFVSENFWNFSHEIRTGILDFQLLKPVNTLFVCFLRLIRAPTMINAVIPWSFMIYYGNALDLPWGAWLSIPLLLLLALTLLVLIEILISMSMFWTVESFGINFLRMQFQQLSRWPDFVYRTSMRRLFTFFVPLLLVGSAPVHFLFGESKGHWLLLMLAFIPVLLILIAIFWRFGLKGYESASS